MTQHYKKSAFTIAEVLITLLIIGVVASIVIPNLINDSQNAELKVQFKKMHATVSQTYNLILLDNGGSIVGLCSSSEWTSPGCLANIFKPYLSINKSCSNSLSEGCWHQANQWYYLSPSASNGPFAGLLLDSTNKTNSFSGFILNNGAMITFFLANKDCSNTLLSNIPYCGYFMVDTNGFKGPNTVGKDIYSEWIISNRIIPVGVDDVYNGDCMSTKQGWSCAVKVLNE